MVTYGRDFSNEAVFAHRKPRLPAVVSGVFWLLAAHL